MLDKGLLHLWFAGGLLDAFCRTGIEPHPKTSPGTILKLHPNKSAAGKNFVCNPSEESTKNREAAQASEPRGEMVIVVASPEPQAEVTAVDLDSLLRQALGRVSLKEAVAEVAAVTGASRREVYQRALALDKERGHGG